MVRKSHDDALGVSGAETIIGTGVTVEGQLNSESDISIDGRLTGNISTLGDINIGVNAVIKADVSAANVTVAGELAGNISASAAVIIRETGQVQGDITSHGLSINPGGVFIGRNHMQVPANLLSDGDDSSKEPEFTPAKTPLPPRRARKL
jgi:cytoskeletal protein CcmA (bactofilin family)